MTTCTYMVRTGLPDDVFCTRRGAYLVLIKAAGGGSSHALPRCKSHLGKTVTGWLDTYGKGVTVTVEAAQ